LRGWRLFKDAKNAEKTMEIDFLIQNGIKIVPLEVKSAKCREHISLDRLAKAYPSSLGRKYVICTKDRFEDGGVVYLPIYMAQYL